VGRNPTLAYVAPFVVYVGLLALGRSVALSPLFVHTARFVIVLAVILLWSRPFLDLRPAHALASMGLGLVVFVIWIGPDLLFGYRHHWLFENSLTGRAVSGVAPSLEHDTWFLVIRMFTTAALVPVLEELFWRGWLMRWLIDNRDFQKVPLGTYQALAFWMVAILFASEHGPYWEVGLIAGIAYNWWLVRSKNLADCILAHAVTNAALGIYVITAGAYRYWL
jgi:CAAX prenyl protease-like protein